MDDLIMWLRTQLDDDEREQVGVIERVGRALAVVDLEAFPGAYEARKEYYDELAEVALKAAGFDPARVLREVGAKRKIIALHAVVVERVNTRFNPRTGERNRSRYELCCDLCGLASDDPTSACETVRLLALPFSDRPGYQEEWKP
jgi:hypothetical protein